MKQPPDLFTFLQFPLSTSRPALAAISRSHPALHPLPVNGHHGAGYWPVVDNSPQTTETVQKRHGSEQQATS